MGKKLRTNDNLAPPDVFEKALLESHQAATVVLMLESPEDDIVTKACAALYRYSEKCDENKLTLLNIESIIERLLALLLHDEHSIRRNACMAIASISQHHDARKYMRKFKFAIPRLIQLISLEVDDVVREFATLCLSSLVVDFSGKVSLWHCSGLVPLVACLSSGDPDVIKNSIETLALVLQDYEVRAAFRDVPGGFSTVMALLKSEYSIIQHQALVALTLAAVDGENRAVLCDLGIVQEIMDFLTRPETQELHVFAVMFISNCLDDPRVLKLFKDAGGLQLLVGLITDKQPLASDEEKSKDKDAKPKKEKASRTPRNRDREVIAADDDKLKAKSVAEPNIAVMPDMKEHATKAIARCARLNNCQKVLHEAEVEKKLIALLVQEKFATAHVAVVLALGVMAECNEARDAINRWDGIDPLVKMASKNDNPDMLEAVSFAFANLTANHPNNCIELWKCGALDAMIPLLSETQETTASHTATALANMAPHGDLCAEMVRLQVIPALVNALANTESTLVQSRALWALGTLVVNADAQNQFVNADGLQPLVRMLQSGDSSVYRNASWVVSLLATDEALAVEICNLGGLEILRQVQLSFTKRNQFSDIALSKLYDSQPVSKYAYIGILGANNLIADGFYDVGQLKIQDQLKSLEDYGKEELSDRLLVIVINPKPEAPVSIAPVAEVELSEKNSRTTAPGTGRTSRTGGREQKSKRAQKEKDDKQKEDKHGEKQREEEQAALAQVALMKEAEKVLIEVTKESQVFVVPSDPVLLHYIEHATEMIRPLSSIKEQSEALAKFVSEKTGGAMCGDKLSSYPWQEHIAQLKQMAGSNVLPLGLIKTGFFCHRALLFKVLADRIGLQTVLVRGDYNRAWNEIVLPAADINEVQQQFSSKRLEPKTYIIDVMFEPGRLIDTCSCEARAYMTAHSWSAN